MDQRNAWNQPHQVVLQQQPTSSVHIPVITDNVRFAIIEAISVRPGIWDVHRDKMSSQNRKELFHEVAEIINQQFGCSPQLNIEDVEKVWKNLKDTYVKTRKKVTYDHEGCLIRPKWKFFEALIFLDGVFNQVEFSVNKQHGKKLRNQPTPLHGMPKRMKSDGIDGQEVDEFMSFCKSLYFPLREIGEKDRVQYLTLQKTIRDTIHETQMAVLTNPRDGKMIL